MRWLGSRPLILIAVPFALGCRFGAAALECAPSWILPAGTVTLAVTLAATAWRAPSRSVALAAVVVVAALAGALRAGALGAPRGSLAHLEEIGVLDNWIGRPVEITGRPVGLVSRRDLPEPVTSVDLEVELLSSGRQVVPVFGRVRMTVAADLVEQLRAAGRVRAWVTLVRSEEHRNPGWRNRQAWRGHRDGPRLSVRVKSARLVKVLPGSPSKLRAARELASRRLDDAFARRDGLGLARALTLGDRAALDEELVDGLRASGTAHVLAVSGLHVALTCGALLWLSTALGLTRRRALVLTVTAAWTFAVVAGFGVPVLRASLLVTSHVAGELLRRSVDRWNALGAAALVTSLLRPDDALGLGFLLTFGAAAALSGLSPRLRGLLPGGRSVAARTVLDAIAASTAAWLALTPLSASAFHRGSWLTPGLNLVVVPVASLATGLSLLTVLVALVSAPLASVPAAGVELLQRLLENVSTPGAWAELRLGGPPTAWLAIHASLVTAWCTSRDPRWQWVTGLAVIASVAHALTVRPSGDARPAVASLHVLDVGQGSAALVELPRADGRPPCRVLVDGGGRPRSRFDVGERVVAPALWALGVTRLDAVVLTHSDFDHRGGLPFVVSAFEPDRVLTGPGPASARPALADLRRAADHVGARRELVAEGDVIECPGARARLRVAWPPRSPALRRDLDTNDASVVLVLEQGRSGGALALLTGDLERAGERRLLRKTAPSATVLLVGHHGSATSTSEPFLRRIAPRVAVISAGRRNRFGHPSEEVTSRLDRHGVLTWVTAWHGAIRVDFDGRLATVTHADSPRVRIVPIRSQLPSRR